MAEDKRIETTVVEAAPPTISTTTNREFIMRRLRQLIGHFLRERSEGAAKAVIRMLDLIYRSSPATDSGPDRDDFRRLLDHWHQLAAAVSRDV